MDFIKSTKKILLFTLPMMVMSMLFWQCDEEFINPESISTSQPVRTGEDFNLNYYSKFEQTKIIIGKAILKWSRDNDFYRIVEAISTNENFDNKILIGDFHNVVINEKSLFELILDNIDLPNQVENFQNACEDYPHLSISLPPWFDKIPAEIRDELRYGVFPVIYKLGEDWRGYDLKHGSTIILSKNSHLEIIPIRITEADDVIPIDENNITISGQNVLEAHFPHTTFCPDKVSSLNEFMIQTECNSKYNLLDIIALRDYLRNECFMPPAEICDNGIDDDGDGLIDSDDPDCVISEICNNGIDDDMDGEVDEGCIEICNNGIDDDGDGDIDGNDDDCIMGGEICTNGTDDDGDGLVDGWDPDCNPGVELCNNNFDDDGDGLVDSDDPDCACEDRCERDCRTEKNVIEGIRFSNTASIIAINNQPGGEPTIILHYDFVHSRMCGDLNVNNDCPPSTIRKVLIGKYEEFMETQFHQGTPSQSELPDVVFFANLGPFSYYIKAFPKYFDIPNVNSPEGIYSQLPYLNNTSGAHWDGFSYGNVVTFSVHEHDEVIVTQTTKVTVKVTNTSKVALGLKFPFFKKEGSFDFDYSNSTEKTSEETITIEAEKDVDLGQASSVYCDKNYQNSTIGYGINKSTGALVTHMAFYY